MSVLEREEWVDAARSAGGDSGVGSGTDAFLAQARAGGL